MSISERLKLKEYAPEYLIVGLNLILTVVNWVVYYKYINLNK